MKYYIPAMIAQRANLKVLTFKLRSTFDLGQVLLRNYLGTALH
jgi:hypothetical protein